jgi:hypothetical protein
LETIEAIDGSDDISSVGDPRAGTCSRHRQMVSKWLGHANFSITLNVYGA